MACHILEIHRDSIEAWAWMPHLLRRIKDFCVATDPETSPVEAEDFVRAAFCLGDARQRVWITVDEHEIIGHLWATVEPYHQSHPHHVLIRQAQVNDGMDIRSETAQVFHEIERWTRSIGLERLLMLTHRNPAAMARAWGFQHYKSIMLKEIGKKPVEPAQVCFQSNGVPVGASIVKLTPPV